MKWMLRWTTLCFGRAGKFAVRIPASLKRRGVLLFYGVCLLAGGVHGEGPGTSAGDLSGNGEGKTVYFLAADVNGSREDSFVVPLSDEEHIREARRLISEDETKLVFARIAKGRDFINRNWLAPGKPAWSWHISEFFQFADGVPASLEGNPTRVENDLCAWMNDRFKRGQIGFYSVVEELDMYLWVGIEKVEGGLRFTWRDLGSEFAYTLEQFAPDGNEWQPVPGGDWPIVGTSWILEEMEGDHKTFRVRAERRQNAGETVAGEEP